ncbi:MAG TPA: hypothetical protein VL728_00130 [Cyclobacteriaceae bacterium]|jgi:hypothetical protein|nr:hypothetical protein [Cyclobacteriaceae bacterium]
MRSIVLVGTMFLAVSSSFAQRDSSNTKKANHYLGVQANQLLRQLFNLSGNTTVVANPYLINYSVNSAKSGWGLNVGIGYTVDQSNQSDANTTNNSQTTNFSFRIGAERKVALAKKWMFSYGFDFLEDKMNTTSTAKSQFQFNSNETDIDLITKDSGFGPRFTLNFFVTPKILIGTEVTYYYKAITTSQNTTNSSTTISINPSTGQQVSNSSSSSTESTQKLKQFHFTAPANIYLTLKF